MFVNNVYVQHNIKTLTIVVSLLTLLLTDGK